MPHQMTMMRIKNEEYEEAEGELCDPSTCFFRLEVLVARSTSIEISGKKIL